MIFQPARATLHTLANADGSATYTAPRHTHTIIAGVNYPVEVPRRSDEVPDSTFVEVHVRPHNGVGMVKERHIEELIKRTLQTVVLGQETPRTMLQITLQITSVEADESLPGGMKGGGQAESYLDLLVSSLNASILGCLDAGVQMRQMIGAALMGTGPHGALVAGPNVAERKRCESLHAFAFCSDGSCVLMESEGRFDMAGWKLAEQTARKAVLGERLTGQDDIVMTDTSDQSDTSIMKVIRTAVQERVAQDTRWSS